VLTSEEERGSSLSQWCQEASALPAGAPHISSIRLIYGQKRAGERTRTANLLITSDRSGVAGVCRGLQIPHI
jgi:hypothetical protein